MIACREEGLDAIVGFFLGTLSRGVDLDPSTFTENTAEVFASGESVFFTLSGSDAAGAVAIREQDFEIGFMNAGGGVGWIRQGGVQVTVSPVRLVNYRSARP